MTYSSAHRSGRRRGDVLAHGALAIGPGNAGLTESEPASGAIAVAGAGIGRVAAEDGLALAVGSPDDGQDAAAIRSRGAVLVGPASAVKANARVPDGADTPRTYGAVVVASASIVAAFVDRQRRRPAAIAEVRRNAVPAGHRRALGVRIAAVGGARLGTDNERGGRARRAVVEAVVAEGAQQLGTGRRGANALRAVRVGLTLVVTAGAGHVAARASAPAAPPAGSTGASVPGGPRGAGRSRGAGARLAAVALLRLRGAARADREREPCQSRKQEPSSHGRRAQQALDHDLRPHPAPRSGGPTLAILRNLRDFPPIATLRAPAAPRRPPALPVSNWIVTRWGRSS